MLKYLIVLDEQNTFIYQIYKLIFQRFGPWSKSEGIKIALIWFLVVWKGLQIFWFSVENL